jgi:hypothetical protein
MRLYDLFVKAGCRHWGGRRGVGLRLFAGEFTLAGYSLVRLRDALDPVLKLAASLRQLLGYHVAGTGRSPIRETCGECYSLAGSKLVFCHSAAFPMHACGPGTPRGLCVHRRSKIHHPGKAARNASCSRCGDGSALAAVLVKTRMPDPPLPAPARMLATF